LRTAVLNGCLLDAHHDHAQNIRFETPFETTPAIASEVYLDTFGNSVRRLIAPPGDLTFSATLSLRIAAGLTLSSSTPKRSLSNGCRTTH